MFLYLPAYSFATQKIQFVTEELLSYSKIKAATRGGVIFENQSQYQTEIRLLCIKRDSNSSIDKCVEYGFALVSFKDYRTGADYPEGFVNVKLAHHSLQPKDLSSYHNLKMKLKSNNKKFKLNLDSFREGYLAPYSIATLPLTLANESEEYELLALMPLSVTIGALMLPPFLAYHGVKSLTVRTKMRRYFKSIITNQTKIKINIDHDLLRFELFNTL